MTTIAKISSRNLPSVGRRSLVKGGMARHHRHRPGARPSPRAEAKKLVMAHLNAVPESARRRLRLAGRRKCASAPTASSTCSSSAAP